MEIEQNPSINEKSDEEIAKKNKERKEKRKERNREYQRAWRQRKRDMKKKYTNEEKQEKKRKRHRENQRAYYQRTKGLKENDKNVKELFPKKLSDLQTKRKKLDSNEDQENVVQCRASQNLENVPLEQNQFPTQQLRIYDESHEHITPKVILHRNTDIPTDAQCTIKVLCPTAEQPTPPNLISLSHRHAKSLGGTGLRSRTGLRSETGTEQTGILDTMSDKTKQLIENVKKYPVLYDPSHENYKYIKVKNKIWDEIAEVIKEKDGDAAKAKWRNLRDSYGKHLRLNKTKPDQTAKHIHYKAWPWVNQMLFLQPYFKNTITNNEKKTKQEPSQYAPTDYQHHDETDLIFLGYSKMIKKMPMRLQAQVKFNIAKIIMDAEIENIETNNPYESNIIGPDPVSPTDRNDISNDYCDNLSPKYEETTQDFSDYSETKENLDIQCTDYSLSGAEAPSVDPLPNSQHNSFSWHTSVTEADIKPIIKPSPV